MTRLDRISVLSLLAAVAFVAAVVADRASRPAHALIAQQCVSPALATQTARERDEWKRKAIGLMEVCGKIPLPTRTPPLVQVDW